MKRILAPVVLLAACLALLFWLQRPEERTSHQPELPPGSAGPEAPAEPEAEALASTPLAQAPEDETRDARQVATAPSEKPKRRAWPAEETRWLEVDVIAPAGTPLDEEAWVLALEAEPRSSRLHDEEGPLVALHGGVEPALIEGLLGAAVAGVDGHARLGLPPDVEETWLVVGGSYLYSQEPLHLGLDEVTATVELRPILGAWISGRLLPPPGEKDADLAGVEIDLRWSINASLQLGTAGAEDLNRETHTDGAGRFEFRAVPVGKPQTLASESPTLAVTIGEDLLTEPGQHAQVELPVLRGGHLTGRVVDEDGTPVVGAEVHALGGEFLGNPTVRLRETESDGEGRFVLSNVTPGKVWVRARAEEFQDLLDTPFELEDGEQRDAGDLVLTQGLAVAGIVTFPDGSPAAGTYVQVEPDLSENLAGGPVDPRAYIGANSGEAADASGAFRIAGLGGGPWAVSARLQVPEEAAGDRAVGRWSASEAAVHAPADELSLVLEEPVLVSGQVLDGKGEPVTSFSIHAARAGSQWYMPPSEEKREGFEPEDGRFLMSDLRSGKWTFTAEAEGYARSEESELTLPTEESLALVLHRPVRLAGEVRGPDGELVAGAEVTKELEGTEVFEAMQGRGDWPTARSDGEGKFLLEGLAPGAGSVLAKKDGLAPSAAVAFELAEGEAREDIVLTLRRGGTISGEVYDSDGQRADGCMVILQMPTLQERRFANTDARGTFVERGLTPGTWQVQAFPGIASLQGADGEALDQGTLLAALEMTTVELADEVEEHVVLGELPEDPVRVHGRVTLDGAPVSESVISFVPAGGGGMDLLKIKPLEDDGSYSLQLDEPGDYLVTIQTTSTPGRQNSVEFRRSVPSGEDHQLDFEMPLGRVSGHVRGPDGGALPGARVTLNMEGGLVFGTVFGGQYNETLTDENGDYDMLYLRPGHYSVAAGGSFLGGILGGEGALGRVVQSVEVGEDQWVRDIDFRLERPGRIRGTVRDGAGTPVGGASIFVRDEDGRLLELFSVFQTNATGAFEVPSLAPGDYTVTARTAELASSGTTPVRVAAGETSEVTVVVDAGTVLLVTLVDKSGADVPSRVSVIDEDGREMNGMLGLTEIMERYSGAIGSSVQRVGPLPPGTYRVRAFAEDGRSTERPVTLSGKPERKVKLRLK